MLKPLVVKTSNGPTENISRIIDRDKVLGTEDTILSDKFQKEGMVVTLPGTVSGVFGKCDKVHLPPCPLLEEDGRIILDDIALKSNNLARTIRLYNEGKKPLSVVEKSLQSLQKLVINKIAHKPGLLCREIIGRRLKNSGRAVLIPSRDPRPEYAGIPRKIFRKSGMTEGCLVIIGRDPTIWHGSIEVVLAREVPHSCIELHPVLFKQLGADCDGDTIWVMKVPDDTKLQEQARAQLLYLCKKTTISIKSSNLSGIGTDIDWTKITQTSQRMNDIDGFSIGPDDIMQGLEPTERFSQLVGKNPINEARVIAKGMDGHSFINYLLSINEAMLAQKVYLGPIGAASQKLKLVAGRNPVLVESANYLSEHAQQMLFDVKGVVQGEAKELANFLDILDIINMAGGYRSTEHHCIGSEDVLAVLSSHGIDPKRAGPIIRAIYTGFPLLLVAKETPEITQETTNMVCDIVMRFIEIGDTENMELYLRAISNILGISIDRLIGKFTYKKMSLTLDSILSDSIYTIMNPFSSPKLLSAVSELADCLRQPGNVVPNSITGYILKGVIN